MNKVRAIIFDMDGVLIDAKEWHYDALNMALELFGLTITKEQHNNEFDGLPTKDKLARLSSLHFMPENKKDAICFLKQKYTIELAHAHCKPNDNHISALEKFKRIGLRMAVASNSIRNSVDTLLDLAELNDYFEFTLSNQDVLRGKPCPDIYNLAIDKLNLFPNECVIVEDNPHGIAAAKATGAHVLEVEGPNDVNYNNIMSFIKKCESGMVCPKFGD